MNRLIITDSSFMSKEEADQLGVGFLPLIVNMDGISHEDFGDSNLRTKLKNILETSKDISTSLGSIGKFTELVEEGLEKHDEVIFLGLSKGLSNQHSVFKQMESEYKGLHVIDTRGVSFVGYEMVKLVLKSIKAGVDSKSIQGIIDDYFKDMKVFALVSDLTRLINGGRINPNIAKLAKAMKIKPLIYLSDQGKLEKYGKCRTIDKGIKSFLKEIIHLSGKEMNNYKLYVGSCERNSELTEEVFNIINKELVGVEIFYKQIPNTILVHTGKSCVVIGGVKNV